MTGMGFIGGGAILKYSGKVQGTATAASLWATGAIGLAVASHRLEIALLISAATFLTLRYLKPVAASQDDDIDDSQSFIHKVAATKRESTAAVIQSAQGPGPGGALCIIELSAFSLSASLQGDSGDHPSGRSD